jgi:hypothetical protein
LDEHHLSKSFLAVEEIKLTDSAKIAGRLQNEEFSLLFSYSFLFSLLSQVISLLKDKVDVLWLSAFEERMGSIFIAATCVEVLP